MLDQIQLQHRIRRVHSYNNQGQQVNTPESCITAEMPEAVWQQVEEIIRCYEVTQRTAAGQALWQQLELVQRLTNT